MPVSLTFLLHFFFFFFGKSKVSPIFIPLLHEELKDVTSLPSGFHDF